MTSETPKVEWYCKRCITGTQRYHNTERCVDCEFYLQLKRLKWCQKCGNTYPKHMFKKSYCNLCRSAADAKRYIKNRKKESPEGYVLLKSIDFGYSPSSMSRLIKDGWLKGLLWRKGEKGYWWIKKLDVYPPRPPYKQRASHATTISQERELPE